MVPPEWYGGDLEAMERLVEKLLERRELVRGWIDDFRESVRRPFPNWMKADENALKDSLREPGWADDMRSRTVM